MKQLFTCILSVIAVLGGANLNAQNYKWVRGGGTTADLPLSADRETVEYMCTDPNGNVYAFSKVGGYPLTADTFLWPGGVGSSNNLLFTSHNCNGQMRFAKLITGTGNSPHGVVADNAGHVYIAFDGRHSGSNPLRIIYDTTINGLWYCNETIVQFDTLGDLKWLRMLGVDHPTTYAGTGGAYNYLALDGFQNPHLVAIALSGVALTPTFTTTHRGFYDHAFDASGNLLIVKTIDMDTTLLIYGMNIDKQSNKLYAYGQRSFDFTSTSSYVYLASFDNDRNRIWIDTLSNPLSFGKGFGEVVPDGHGHLYVTMGGSGQIAYRGDTVKNTLSTTPYAISVVMKADTAGNPLWMRTFSADISVNGLPGLTLYGNNKVAAAGNMAGRIACTTDTINIYSGEGQNAFFTILDTAGYVHELKQVHGMGFYDGAMQIVAGKAANLYMGGRVETNIWGGSITPYTSVGGNTDYFIMKYGVDCGCTTMPVANYTYSGSDFIRNFTYTGASSIDSVRWSFGDGGTSTILSPSHTYTMAGTYTVCVRIYSPCGNDMKCYEVNVSCAALPVASYIDTGNLVRGFVYTGTTTALYDSVRWSFGDGMHDTGLHVIHTYPSSGNYTVCAIIYTRCGNDTVCNVITVSTTSVFDVNTITADIKVYPNPTAASLYVTGVTGSIKYRLTNMVGATVQSGTLSQNMEAIDISLLAAGVYVLEIGNENGDRKVMRVRKE